MCGIAGIAYFGTSHSPSEALIRSMCDTIVHRGPDDEGIHIADGVGLGMRRLAIIDLKGGRQPIFNEDRSIRTVFNGEIYNFRELRKQLAARGHQFSTRSDTEVIVHAYEEFGGRFPDHLNGMFAIALHDSGRRKLYLARDHLGIKPLYYATGDGWIVWGSEIKAILASALVARDLDVNALGQFMSWEYVPGSGTLLKKVRKLEPAQLLELDLATGRQEIHTFWDIPSETSGEPKSMAAWEEEVDSRLSGCVRRQLVSDVPLGAFLSGGVDSSLVVAAMESPQTFSIGFVESSYNELPYAQAVADHLGVNHTFEIVQPDVLDLFDRLIYLLDDPIGDFSIFPTFLLSQMTRKHVKVALSGDGGDELFGGYETYAAERLARSYERLPAWLRHGLVEKFVRRLKPSQEKKGLVNKARRFVEGLEHAPGLAHARWRLFVGESLRESLFTPTALSEMFTGVDEHISALFDRATDRDAVNRCLYVDTRSYLCDNILTKVDRMSMGVSLETRVPYLDKDLVALAFSIPGRFKLDGNTTKPLLKRVAARHIPARCVYRPKEGFSIPIKSWLGERFRPLMEDLLERRRLEDEGLFQCETVERLKREHLEGTANHSHVLWSLVVFQAWRDRWLN